MESIKLKNKITKNPTKSPHRMGSMKIDQWKLFNMNDRIKGLRKTNRGSMTYGTKPKVMTFLSLESQKERTSVVQNKYFKTY